MPPSVQPTFLAPNVPTDESCIQEGEWVAIPGDEPPGWDWNYFLTEIPALMRLRDRPIDGSEVCAIKSGTNIKVGSSVGQWAEVTAYCQNTSIATRLVCPKSGWMSTKFAGKSILRLRR